MTIKNKNKKLKTQVQVKRGERRSYVGLYQKEQAAWVSRIIFFDIYILVFFGGQKFRYEMLKILGVHSMFSWISVPAWHPQPLDKVPLCHFNLR